MGGWIVEVSEDPSSAEVMPVGDLVVHIPGGTCGCNPDPSLVPCQDGTLATMHIHQAADRRELVEQDHGGG